MKFTAVLVRPAGNGTLTYFELPAELFADADTNHPVAVRGRINHISVRSKAMPNGVGGHCFVLNQTLRDELGVTVGDTVEVSLETNKSN